ncbi:hypothetical protein [Lunatibacter salilacus]|uniref:hypothetical protein n=1 Tax=Lunatibacter salilacus TaxID=2483804 RepID=UPI0018FECF87|nr:hypothetical protein [Lunatibacter salilacus]
MKTSKRIKTIFWATTGFNFLFEGVMPALTGHTEFAKEGIRHLGYINIINKSKIHFEGLASP